MVMTQFLTNEWEVLVGKNRVLTFCGTALIAFHHLDFYETSIRKANVRRLLEIYRTEGCLRFQPQNRIAALVTRQDWELAISQARISKEDLLDPTKIQPPRLCEGTNIRVHCLGGGSRIEAAKQFLSPSDHEWLVELYLADGTSLTPAGATYSDDQV